MEPLTDKEKREYATYKYNGGLGALLCSHCKVIIRNGKTFTEDDWKCMRGELRKPKQYCEKCITNTMLKETTYRNRYKDEIKFEFIGDKTIKVSGFSPYYRIGWPNVYDKAYESFINEQAEHGMELVELEEFKKIVHDYNNEKIKPYSMLVYSDQNTIDMWDPSGGPYLSAGTDMREFFYKFKFPDPLIIKEFKTGYDGYVLILLK